MRKPAAIFIPTATRWKPSARPETATGAGPHWTTLTSVVESSTSMGASPAVPEETATAPQTGIGTAIEIAPDRAAFLRATTRKPAATSALKATGLRLSVKGETATGARHPSTTSTNAPGESSTITGVSCAAPAEMVTINRIGTTIAPVIWMIVATFRAALTSRPAATSGRMATRSKPSAKPETVIGAGPHSMTSTAALTQSPTMMDTLCAEDSSWQLATGNWLEANPQ